MIQQSKSSLVLWPVILLTGFLSGYSYGSPQVSNFYLVLVNIFIFLEMLALAIYYIISQKNKTFSAANSMTDGIHGKLSHELRTPMIGIIGAVELLERENLSPDQLYNVEIIKNSSNNLLTIIDNVLDLNKLELGQMDISLRPCSVKSIFNFCVGDISRALKPRKLNITIDIAEQANILFMSDEGKLKQIISTLLNKAVEFSGNHEVILRAAWEEALPPKSILTFSVIFCHSFNLPAAVRQASAAEDFTADLSFYLCQQLAKLLGGKVWSAPSADKSFFRLCLPVTAVPGQPADEPETAISAVSSLPFSRYKVLLVEDNNLNAGIMSQMLYNYGFEVTIAVNGLEGLQRLQEGLFDVILMDMQMPVMDGYEASRIIRNNPEYNSIPIIAVTANAMIGDREKCLASGCTSYLAKPFQTRELAEEIEKVLKNKTISSKSAYPDENKPQQSLPSASFLRDLIANMEQSLNSSDWDSFSGQCHKMKIIARALNNKELYNYVSLIETAAQEQRVKTVYLALAELKTCYQNLDSSQLKIG